MFKDLKVFSSNSILEYDICIVGSGPAGISLAKQLLDTNHRIAILESGGLEPESEYQETVHKASAVLRAIEIAEGI